MIMTKKITVHFDICYVPLPPEKRFAYNEAHRLLHELMLKAWLAHKPEESVPAQSDSRTEAGVTTPPDSSFTAMAA